ncbi:hypothetical protein Syun_026751 [Stephania yunnanensis]|uniref:Uncharacterized protein n=1 Tax=Stephania yunnanensis TaxID=152371 RepID=A0AAP0EED8_9MAGN
MYLLRMSLGPPIKDVERTILRPIFESMLSPISIESIIPWYNSERISSCL